MLSSIPTEQQAALLDQVRCHDGGHACPILTARGCLLSYEGRPTVCAVSYPCFAGDAFHAYLEGKQTEIGRLLSVIKTAVEYKEENGGQLHESQV
jgi:hypothetical protein